MSIVDVFDIDYYTNLKTYFQDRHLRFHSPLAPAPEATLPSWSSTHLCKTERDSFEAVIKIHLIIGIEESGL